jgi:hypothetical protein
VLADPSDAVPASQEAKIQQLILDIEAAWRKQTAVGSMEIGGGESGGSGGGTIPVGGVDNGGVISGDAPASNIGSFPPFGPADLLAPPSSAPEIPGSFSGVPWSATSLGIPEPNWLLPGSEPPAFPFPSGEAAQQYFGAADQYFLTPRPSSWTPPGLCSSEPPAISGYQPPVDLQYQFPEFQDTILPPPVQGPTDSVTRAVNDFLKKFPALKNLMHQPAAPPPDLRGDVLQTPSWLPNGAPGPGMSWPGDFPLNFSLGNGSSLVVRSFQQPSLNLQNFSHPSGVIDAFEHSSSTLSIHLDIKLWPDKNSGR